MGRDLMSAAREDEGTSPWSEPGGQRVAQSVVGVWLTDHVQPGYLSGWPG
jgi:hypothetical protein